LDDRKILGSPHPDFTFGIPMNFTFKGFSLDLFWYGSYGNELFNSTKAGTDLLYQTYIENQQFGKRILDSWGMPGVDNPKADLPEVNGSSIENAPMEYYPEISFYIEDGSYLRLSQLILGYDFNVSSWKSIERFRIYLQANNVFTLTNYKGMDPGVTRTPTEGYDFANDFTLGFDSGQYPAPKSFLFGLNITL
jgi:hypothetical protein